MAFSFLVLNTRNRSMGWATVVLHRSIVTSVDYGASKLPENDVGGDTEADTEKDTFLRLPARAMRARDGIEGDCGWIATDLMPK
jgi:hypothetical protein